MNWGHLLFGFTGRINRAKWWLAILIINILYVVVLIVALTTQSEGITGLLGVLFLIAWNWIGLAASAKRLHDLDRSGAWLLVFIGVPILLGLVAIGIVGIAAGAAIMAGQMPEQAELVRLGSMALILALIWFAVGVWALVWFGCLPGTRGPNRFGPDPLEGKI